MGRKANRPVLCVERVFTNERSMIDVFADAYRVHFDEMQRVKSSADTFDTNELTEYNDDAQMSKEDKRNGTAA